MRNFWAVHCAENVEGMEDCMDEEEDHHPGRLAGPTERIPKLVHDIIHQDERDAVVEIFKQDGITGFNPGRWTGKHIPEDNSLFNVLNSDFFKWSQTFQKEKKEKEREQKVLDNIKMLSEWNKEQKLQKTTEILSRWNNFSSLPKTNFAVNPPSYSEVYVPTLPSFKPAFCLGGDMDEEAMQRKSIPYGYSDPMIRNAPNGYGGDPVFFTPSGGWQPCR